MPALIGPVTAEQATARRTRVVVLGSGWGAVSFIRSLDPEAFGERGPYELVVVSPRNYMLYTPLLPSAVGGVVSENSIVESIRKIVGDKGTYYEARVADIDPYNRTLTCVKQFCEVCVARKNSGHTEADHTFSLHYDILLCAVGAMNATFGIPGVKENCWFLKSMEDASRLRRHISKTLEQAALPDVTPEARRAMLSFVVVGGGPTGVEMAAELHDLVANDVTRHMPQIKDNVSITLVDGMDSLLGSFHKEIQTYAGEVFQHSGIKLRLGTKVTAVHEGHISVQLKDGSMDTVPYGTAIWAAGIAMHPLVAQLQAACRRADVSRGLLVDPHLRVLGSQGTIFCLGDAAVTGAAPQAALPPTAQVARQEGEYLAALLSQTKLAVQPAYSAWPARSSWPLKSVDGESQTDVVVLPEGTKPFSYTHMGALAYLGDQKGVMDLPVKTPFLKTLRGHLGGQAWRTLETFMQISHRTRWLVTHDWLRAALFGRNISNI
ncbi:hypothetical protein ABPG75_005073 [Micractinium tetrahymenae]